VKFHRYIWRDMFGFGPRVDPEFDRERMARLIEFRRLGLNSLEQAAQYRCISRETPEEYHPRTGNLLNSHIIDANWPRDPKTGRLIDSVEVDSMVAYSVEPMQELVRDAIHGLIDWTLWERFQKRERRQREKLTTMTRDMVARFKARRA
jgi:hypothetical protein